MAVELWTTGAGIPGFTARQAERAESEGWDGLGLVDSQNLAGDPYVSLAVAAAATTNLKLATAVTNPHTRHPAAAATAAATVQGECGGRFVLGIGRGDSALAHLGLAPAPVAVFRTYLERLQGYLRGEEVPFEAAGKAAGKAADNAAGTGTASGSVDDLGMAGGPTASRIRWLGDVPKVPVDVAATGPKVIDLGATLADRVTFAVGSSAERVSWALARARQIRPDGEWGVYVPVAACPERDEARALLRGGVASFARFSVMHGSVSGPVSDEQRAVLGAVHDAYDMNSHFTHGSPQSAPLTDDVIDTFGIAGPPAYCVGRLQELIDLGISKIVMMPPGTGADREQARASRQLIVREVLPALR